MDSITLAVVGSGGAGVVSLGEMLLKSVAKVGYYGMLRKSFGPQIRGGESAAIVRLGLKPIGNFNGDMHLLCALDWNNFARFGDEIPVTEETLIIQDSQAGPLPADIKPEQVITLDFSGAAALAESAKPNMALLGFLGTLFGCSTETVARFVRLRLEKFSEAIQKVSIAAMEQGAQLKPDLPLKISLPKPEHRDSHSWIATGNQLAGLGALESGIRFVAAYPITPASDSLEWIAKRIESVGGHLVQAEDELSAINMAIGGGYAGVPSMTATSGPGLSLMCEAMGLAVASETPVVVLNVMRGGPSTGIPTKSEQSDLNLALYGMHGDAPHVVLSALSIEDCFATMAWASHLASHLQTLVIVLSDQFIGQSSQIVPPVSEVPFKAESPQSPSASAGEYARYQITESGVSPMAVPGDRDCMYTADGLEHTEHAVPSPKASDHQQQLDKRARKVTQYDYGEFWAEVSGVGEVALICWGSLHAAALEAQALLQAQGIAVKVISLRLLMPLPQQALLATLADVKRIIVVEQNHQAQCAAYLRSLAMPGFVCESFAKPGPSLITPNEIAHQVKFGGANESEGL